MYPLAFVSNITRYMSLRTKDIFNVSSTDGKYLRSVGGQGNNILGLVLSCDNPCVSLYSYSHHLIKRMIWYHNLPQGRIIVSSSNHTHCLQYSNCNTNFPLLYSVSYN